MVEERKEQTKGNEPQDTYAREYIEKLEGELQKICDDILDVMNERSISPASNGESKVFYYKMRGDYRRHFAKYETDDAESEAAKDVRVARAGETKARGVFEGQSSDLVAKIDALSNAIAALEEGRTKGSFLQGSVGAALQRAVMNSEKVYDPDHESVLSFLSDASCGGECHAPQTGEIVGILKRLKDEMSTDLLALEKEGLDRKTKHQGLMKAETKKIFVLTKVIEEKDALALKLQQSAEQVVTQKNTEREELVEKRKKVRDEEEVIIHDAVNWINLKRRRRQ